MSAGALILLSFLKSRVEILMERGDYGIAEAATVKAVDAGRASFEENAENIEELAMALEIEGTFFNHRGETKKALRSYAEIIELLEGKPEYYEEAATVAAQMANIHERLEEFEEAKEYYTWAIQIFERTDPPQHLDIASLSNNLAFIYQTEDNFEEALSLFTKAYEINLEHLGSEHVETADIANNLGTLHYKIGNHEAAEELHKRALEARSESIGEDHVDTAQSHANLALALAGQDKLEAAKSHFESALKAYEQKIDVGVADYALVVSNYTQILRNSGDDAKACTLEKRAAKAMNAA